jgi:hypothetical protein
VPDGVIANGITGAQNASDKWGSSDRQIKQEWSHILVHQAQSMSPGEISKIMRESCNVQGGRPVLDFGPKFPRC